jgi:cyclic-di-GMP-binding protein
MAQDFSFDVVSKVDMQELRNAVDQTLREIATRFDFKDSVSNVEMEGSTLKLHSDDEYRLKALIEVLQGKLVRRGVSLKALEYGKMEPASKGTVRQDITVRQGIDTDKAREMSKLIRDSKRKVQAQIQGDQLRVSSKSKDELQAIMQMLKGQDFGIDLQFVNYR